MLITIVVLIALAIVCSLFAGRAHAAERVLIVGTSPLAAKIVSALHAGGTRHLVNVVEDLPAESQPLFASLVAGPISRLGVIVDEVKPDRIVLALADRRGRLPVQELVRARVRGIAVENGVQFYERLTGKIAIEALTPHDLFTAVGFRKRQLYLVLGHAVSILIAAAALVALSPLLAAIAVAIRLDSPGPVLFVQTRVGLRGRVFRLLKFRTMTPRPAETPASEWVRDNSHRITRVGAWLRRFRLDELPQFVNVVRGDLNLIGPRPHPVCNFELFSSSIPYYSLRSLVRPGLTGWAQVRQGYANGLEEETEKMRYDLYYIKHMSAAMDLRILARTVRVVLAGDGSSSTIAAVDPLRTRIRRFRHVAFARVRPARTAGKRITVGG